MLKDELLRIVKSQREWLTPVEREIARSQLSSFYDLSPMVYFLTGARRSGKSILMSQIIRASGSKNYFCFEDPRAFDFKAGDFVKLEEVFNELFGKSQYYFFDGIHNVTGWERYLRQAVNEKKIVFVTCPTASLLRERIRNELHGRFTKHDVFPFSYDEYLTYNETSAGPLTFQEYLIHGGFPEYLGNRRGEVLSSIVNEILEREVFIRHHLRNTETYRRIALYLFSSIGKEVSYNRLKNKFKVGSPTSIMDYLSFLNDACMFFLVPRFDHSQKARAINPKKVYGIDTGLVHQNSLTSSSNLETILENHVFLELMKNNREVYYFRRSAECDFVTVSQDGYYSVYQVSREINADNEEQEVEGLVEAMEYLKLTKGIIVTFDQEDHILIRNMNIRLVPAWKFIP